jgi:enterochelin esterase-like enzyme
LACRTGRPINATEAEALLGARRFAFDADVSTGLVTVAARPAEGGPGAASGALNADLDEIGAGLYASEFRLAGLEEGMLTFYLRSHLHSAADGSDDQFRMQHWRGPSAPTMRIIEPEPAGALSDHEVFSQALGETRRIAVYLPPGHDPGAGPYPAVIVADGGKVEYYGRQLDPLITSGRLAPIVLIGLRAGQAGIVEPKEASNSDLRNADYLPEFSRLPGRFEPHLVFAAEETIAWAASEFAISTDPADLAVNGRSSGGGFAYHAGLRRPDVFGHALVHSPGWSVPGDIPPPGEAQARFYIVAGRYESGFLRAARLAHGALSDAGYETSLTELSAGHTMEITQTTIADQLMAIFPGENTSPAPRDAAR